MRAVALVSLAFVGCEPQAETEALVEAGSKRPYRVITRKHHDSKQPAAVLFVLHAYATEPEVIVGSFALVPHVVEDRGWILVVPEGRRDGANQLHWNATAACCGEGDRFGDDLGYLRAVLGAVKERHAVDEERVFAFGVSNGAFMAHRWASTPGGELGAIIAVSGVGPGPDDAPFAPTRPVSVVSVHGFLDDVIPYAGKDEPGRRQPSVPDTVARWVTHDECGTESERTRRRSLFFNAIDVETWTGPRAKVTAWKFETGLHNMRDVRFFMSEYLDFIAPR